MPEARYLDPAKVRVTLPAEDASPRVELLGEATIPNAQIKRVLPLSGPDGFIAIQDGSKVEVGILKSLEGMDSDSRALVEQILDRQYFTPKVQAIRSVKAEGGMWHFVVETQRGPAEYYVRNWRDSAHEIAPNRWLVHSVDGQRFEIPTVESLDVQSQALLDQLL
ncbi:MAG: hypothetical protein QOJ65_1013 [Fimbriimonadaceae bacterium]|jgi:hypothetical protein|nr:hypothetical protein [Fimbriimonadaceae bacterium]